MELILMLVAVVFQSGLYLAAPLFIAFLAFKVGQEVGRRAGIPSLQWVLPVTVIGVPSMWAVAGYASFTTQCRNLPEPSFESFPKSRPNGFFLDEEGIAQAPFNRGSLIYDRLPFEFYEQSYFTGNAYSPKAVEHFRRTYSNRKSENIPGPSSEYAVVFSPPQQVTSWWNPPIYVSEIVVMERKSKNVMARAYDLVFGGGIVGQYLHIPKMNYDYRYLSCGFASKEIGVWRTRHGNDPRYSQYVLADANFVSTALSPVGNSDSTASK